jgi:hypothetical protein
MRAVFRAHDGVIATTLSMIFSDNASFGFFA